MLDRSPTDTITSAKRFVLHLKNLLFERLYSSFLGIRIQSFFSRWFYYYYYYTYVFYSLLSFMILKLDTRVARVPPGLAPRTSVKSGQLSCTNIHPLRLHPVDGRKKCVSNDSRNYFSWSRYFLA